MSWLGWVVAGIGVLNVVFFGTLFLISEIDDRKERRRKRENGGTGG